MGAPYSVKVYMVVMPGCVVCGDAPCAHTEGAVRMIDAKLTREAAELVRQANEGSRIVKMNVGK